ncbi:MAG: hypothetical protein ACI4YB_12340 [Oscillospiraceae bacterium]
MCETGGKLFTHFLLIYFILTADFAVLTGLGIVPEFIVGFGWETDMILRSVLLTLPGLVFNSKRELSDKELIIRRVTHFLCIEAIVMFFVYFRDGVRDPKALLLTAASILIAYLFVFIADCYLNLAEAEKMNRMLEEIKKRN